MATKEKKILLPDDPPTGTGVQGEVATQSPQTQPAATTTPTWEDEYDNEEKEATTGKQAERELDTAKLAAIRGVPGIHTPSSLLTTSTEEKPQITGGIKPPSDDMQQRFTLSGMREALEKQYHIESDAERAAREKNERRAKLFASIGDGISALSDMYFSTQGAPMVHDPASGMSERLRQRYEKLDAERKANEAAYQHEYLRQLEQMRREKQAAAAAELQERRHGETLAEQKRHNEEMEKIARDRGKAYASGVDNQNQNRTSSTENQNKNRDARTQQAGQRVANGSGGTGRRGGSNRSGNSGRGGHSTGSGGRPQPNNRGGIGAGNNTQRLFGTRR